VNHSPFPAEENTPRPIGLSAFDSLRAEDEPWLAECYVPPPDFTLMAGWRSVLIFGGVGSGRTALRLALERHRCPPGQKPSLLLVRWPMSLVATTGLTGTALVEEQMRHVLDAVVRAILQHLLRYPADWGQAPAWAQDTLIWFVHRHLRGDVGHHLASLEAEADAEAMALLRSIATASVHEVLYPDAPPPLIVAELTRALEKLGLEGIWVLVAGLEPWLAAGPQRLADTLHAFLSTLALFEHPRFAYKMLLPDDLESLLRSAGSVVRQRADVYLLRQQWDALTLQAIVERRLAFALGEPGFSLADLCEDPGLPNWLARCGGTSPRGWLQFARHFLAAYLAEAQATGKRQPLSKKKYRDIQRRHAPRLYFDEVNDKVIVGWREIQDLPPGPKALLRHLYRHRGRVCQWGELHRVYLKALYPRLYSDVEAASEFTRAEYAGMLDTALWRLRQAIEPDPEQRILVVTVKGKGVRLDNAW